MYIYAYQCMPSFVVYTFLLSFRWDNQTKFKLDPFISFRWRLYND
jgi:hypothetical protein